MEAEEVALECRQQERDRKRAEKEAEEVAPERRRQERDQKRAENDETITRMRADGVSFAKIASTLGNGLKMDDLKNRWTRHLQA